MKYLRRLALKWIDDFGAMPEAEKVAFVLFCSVLGGIAGVVYYAAAHGAPGIVAQEESCAARSQRCPPDHVARLLDTGLDQKTCVCLLVPR